MLLHYLDHQEAKLLQQVAHVTGSMEAKHDELANKGVFRAYARIHQQYAALLHEPGAALEAAKRALFIQWYALSEPACFSGICELEPGTELAVLTYVNAQLARLQPDRELLEMLRYYSSWEYVFQQADFHHLAALQVFVAAQRTIPFIFQQPAFDEFLPMTGRGQMGRYWLSVLS